MDSLYGMSSHFIWRARQASTALFAEECAEFDLTSVQFAALVAIKANSDVDAAVGASRLRPLDHRRRAGAAGR